MEFQSEKRIGKERVCLCLVTEILVIGERDVETENVFGKLTS